MEDLLGRENVNFSLVKPEENDERAKKFKEQRMTRGFDDSETWSLDITIAKFLVPRLKAFKECDNGYPARLTEKKWNKILDEMIEGFELYIKKDEWDFEPDINTRNEMYAKVNKALKQFSKYFQDLWW
jgi:hypothetical protein